MRVAYILQYFTFLKLTMWNIVLHARHRLLNQIEMSKPVEGPGAPVACHNFLMSTRRGHRGGNQGPTDEAQKRYKFHFLTTKLAFLIFKKKRSILLNNDDDLSVLNRQEH